MAQAGQETAPGDPPPKMLNRKLAERKFKPGLERDLPRRGLQIHSNKKLVIRISYLLILSEPVSSIYIS